MSDRFSLVRWRDAKTDPPDDDSVVLTDRGNGWVSDDGEHKWYHEGFRSWITRVLMEPQPTVWCDPSPPGDDALTDAHLRRVLARAVQRIEDCELLLAHKLPDDRDAIARLRRAIEEATPKGDDHE